MKMSNEKKKKCSQQNNDGRNNNNNNNYCLNYIISWSKCHWRLNDLHARCKFWTVFIFRRSLSEKQLSSSPNWSNLNCHGPSEKTAIEITIQMNWNGDGMLYCCRDKFKVIDFSSSFKRSKFCVALPFCCCCWNFTNKTTKIINRWVQTLSSLFKYLLCSFEKSMRLSIIIMSSKGSWRYCYFLLENTQLNETLFFLFILSSAIVLIGRNETKRSEAKQYNDSI